MYYAKKRKNAIKGKTKVFTKATRIKCKHGRDNRYELKLGQIGEHYCTEN